MHRFSSPTQLINVGRFAAIMAMFVFLTGKTLHLSQECSDCSSGVCAADAVKQHESIKVRPCPFGCQHHHPQDLPADEAPGSDHEEHNCTICTVLAQAPSCPVVLGLPDEFQIVVETVALNSASAVAGVSLCTQPRGPPLAA